MGKRRGVKGVSATEFRFSSCVKGVSGNVFGISSCVKGVSVNVLRISSCVRANSVTVFRISSCVNGISGNVMTGFEDDFGDGRRGLGAMRKFIVIFAGCVSIGCCLWRGIGSLCINCGERKIFIEIYIRYLKPTVRQWVF